MTEGLSQAAVARMTRSGHAAADPGSGPGPVRRGAAPAPNPCSCRCGLTWPHCAPRTSIPAILQALVGTGAARASAVGLAQRLTGLFPAEGHEMLLDQIRAQAAVVLGHADGSGRRSRRAPSPTSALTRSPRWSFGTGCPR